MDAAAPKESAEIDPETIAQPTRRALITAGLAEG
jgi:hypothetical protein